VRKLWQAKFELKFIHGQRSGSCVRQSPDELGQSGFDSSRETWSVRAPYRILMMREHMERSESASMAHGIQAGVICRGH
jgi:hypothetical protein